MKTGIFLNVVAVALVAAVFSACAAAPPPVAAAQTVPAQPVSPPDELDAAIREASDYLNGRVPGGSKAVFLNIKSDYPDLSEYILSLLSENAVNDGVFAVVDRQQLDILRAELNFQASGEVSDESAQTIGQMLGAQSIVSGTVSRIGSLYRVQVKAIEVQSAGVQGQWSRNVPNGASIAALTENYSPATAGGGTVARPAPARNPSPAPAATAAAPAAPAVSEADYKIGQRGPAGGFVFYYNEPAPISQTAPVTHTSQTYPEGQNGPTGGFTFYDSEPRVILAAVPVDSSVTYQVGDRGPAGGIIFYINPSATDGWRYLEAAPASTEAKLKWITTGAAFSGTKIEVGTGKQNTQIITGDFSKGVPEAGLHCIELEHGGVQDWFLPSKDELNLMYINLKRKNLGGFKDDWYWSSSESGNYNGAWTQHFSNGSQSSDGGGDRYSSYKPHKQLVRAIRQF
jgi:hypothetical protein